MSNMLPIGEDNGNVGQRDERFQPTHASGSGSRLVHPRMTDSPLRPEEGYRRQDT
jgi:hypothetical protein